MNVPLKLVILTNFVPGNLCAQWAPPCRSLQSQILLGGVNTLPSEPQYKDWHGLCRLTKRPAGPGDRREENGERLVYFFGTVWFLPVFFFVYFNWMKLLDSFLVSVFVFLYIWIEWNDFWFLCPGGFRLLVGDSWIFPPSSLARLCLKQGGTSVRVSKGEIKNPSTDFQKCAWCDLSRLNNQHSGRTTCWSAETGSLSLAGGLTFA